MRLMRWWLLCLLAGCAPGHLFPPQVCSVTKAAEVPLRIERGFVVAPAMIEDSAVTLIVDTGAEGSLVTPAAVESLHLRPDWYGQTDIRGTGGSITTQNARLRSFGIGGITVKNRSLAVGPAADAALQVSGLLGEDWLSPFDVDLDLPKRMMTLYLVRNCGDDYLPWRGPITSLPIRLYRRNLVLLSLALNGQKVTALLDSGANASVLTEAAAERAGADAAAMAGDPVGRAMGVDGDPRDLHRHRFNDLQVGAEHFHNVTIAVSELHNSPADMLLGADWLRSHRVWIAYGARRVFVQRD